jgi:uncharacterized protein YjbJ (UPF0337 family)
MSNDIAKGDWKQLSGAIKHTWGKLTDDDLLRAKGDGEYLVGRLQEYYGLTKAKAEQSLHELGYKLRGEQRRVATSDRRGSGDDATTERLDR